MSVVSAPPTIETPRAAPGRTEPLKPAEHTLLFVDDEPTTLDLLSYLFTHEGYIVLTAHSAEAALKVMSANTVSLVIADQRLPGMSGVELLKVVRQNWPDAFRIILTASGDMQTAIDSINQGHVFRYMSKPWDNQELRAAVRDGVQRYELLLRNRQLGMRIVRQTSQLRTLNESLELKVAERTAEIDAKRHELENTLVEVVKTLSGILEMRGVGPKGHALHVSQGCESVIEKMHLPDEERRNVSMAALLHDLGKVALPDELVRKESYAFNRNEAALFREHPMLGQSILSGIRCLEDVGRIIRHQSEWYNGSGYPDGLAGESIPIGSRILAVVAFYEERHDLPGLEQVKGRRFDPRVVDAFVTCLNEQAADARRAVLRPIMPHELMEGMVLVNDVYTGRGLLLVTGGKAVDKPTLEKIRNFNRVDPILNKIYVRG